MPKQSTRVPLLKNVVQVSLEGGMDTKLDEHLVESPVLSLVREMQYDKTGSLSKRNGYAAEVTAGFTNNPTAHTIFDHGGQLRVTNQDSVQSLIEDEGRWRNHSSNGNGGLVPVDLSVRRHIAANSTPTRCDSNVTPEYEMVAWTDTPDPTAFGEDTWYAVYERSTGQPVIPPTVVTGMGRMPQVLVLNTRTFVLISLNTTTNNVTALSINTTTNPFTVSATFVLLNAVFAFDADSTNTDSTGGIIAIRSPGGSGALTDLHLFDAVPAITASNLALAGDHEASQGRTIFHNSITNEYCCGVSKDPAAADDQVWTFTVNETTLAVTTGPSPIYNWLNTALVYEGASYITITTRGVTGTMLIASSGLEEDFLFPTGEDRFYAQTQWADLTTAGVLVAGTVGLWHNAYLATKAFQPDDYGAVFGLRTNRSGSLVNRAVSVDHETPAAVFVMPYTRTVGATTTNYLKPVARFQQDRLSLVDNWVDTLNCPDNFQFSPPRVSSTDNINWVFNRIYSIKYSDRHGDDIYLDDHTDGIVSYDMQWQPLLPSKMLQSSGLTVSSGAVAGQFDGDVWSEIIPHTAPEIIEFNIVGGVGVTPGRYEGIAVFVFIDSHGNEHRSAPSRPRVIDTTGGAVSDITFIALHPSLPTAFNPDVKSLFIELYMTAADGAIHYYTLREPAFGPDAISAVPGRVSLQVDFPTFVGAPAVSLLTDNPILYTTGGILGNLQPPAAIDVATVNGRVWVASAETGTSVWFSKISSPALPPEFTGAFEISVQTDSETITALGALDDKVLVFTSSSIFYIAGAGPNDAGAGQSLVGPKLISGDVGCVSRSSVISGPFGVMFQSEKGIYNIDRGLNVNYIGAPVEDFFANAVAGQDILINSAVLLDKQNQVRFGMQGALTNVTLTYDYYHGAWSIFFDPSTTSMGQTRSACSHDNLYSVILDSPFDVASESEGLPTDLTNHIPTFARTAWLKLAGLQGFQRIWRAYTLGRHSTGDVRVTLEFEYQDTTGAQVSDWTEAEVQALGFLSGLPTFGDPMQLSVHVGRQKSQSMRMTVEEVVIAPGSPPTNGSGLVLTGIGLEVGMKEGLHKLNEAGAKR